jgi:alpha-aminoadipic semialdehyde synthase
LAICDITCDYRGSIEFLRKFTTPDDPFWLYHPPSDKIYSSKNDEMAPECILYHPMDFLPSELPRDASLHFSTQLLPLLPDLVNDDANVPVTESTLRGEMKGAMITSHGALTPNFEYITQMRRENEEEEKHRTPVKESPEVRLMEFYAQHPTINEEIGTVLTGSQLEPSLAEKLQQLSSIN